MDSPDVHGAGATSSMMSRNVSRDARPKVTLRKCLVTGGSGYLGRHIAESLLRRGYGVRVLDLRPFASRDTANVEFVRGDVRRYEDVLGACRGVDTVFHAASIIDLLGYCAREERKKSFDVNVEGTRNVIRACGEAGVARLIYTSSVNVVLDGPVENGDETLPYARRFIDVYSETKALAEKTVLAANGTGSLLTCAIRPSGIYGPGEEFFLPRVVDSCAKGRMVARIGDGRALADNSFIENLVAGHILAAEHLVSSSPVAGQAYFINDGEPLNYFEFFRPLFDGMGFKFPRFRVPAAPLYAIAWLGEALHRLIKIPRPVFTRIEVKKMTVTHYFSIDKARRDFGYRPSVDTAEALRQCLPHCRDLLAQYERIGRFDPA